MMVGWMRWGSAKISKKSAIDLPSAASKKMSFTNLLNGLPRIELEFSLCRSLTEIFNLLNS